MSHSTNDLYEFRPFRLDATERLLLREGESVSLTPKAFDLLLALVKHHGHLLEKDELLKKVWPDTFVEEANLSYNISLIRKALGPPVSGAFLSKAVKRPRCSNGGPRSRRLTARTRKFDSEARIENW